MDHQPVNLVAKGSATGAEAIYVHQWMADYNDDVYSARVAAHFKAAGVGTAAGTISGKERESSNNEQ
jgi:hypothetical protein